jgi:Holliday junction resolvase RusA-like endonuclease
MPASWSKKKREEMDRQPHQNKPDLDNLIKAFKDALLSEDSGVWKYGEMEKRWATRGFIVVL